MRTHLILNPKSGQGRAAIEKRRLLKLISRLPDVDYSITSGPDDARLIASEAVKRGYDRIVVAGGDGTINQVINGIGDSRIPIGIIPLGTGNILAHDQCIPTNDINSAFEIIEAGFIKEVDLAKANGRRFLLMAGLGFDAEVVDAVLPAVKDIFGKMAYASALLAQLFTYSPTRFRLIFNDGSVYESEAYAVIVANCGSYAYNFKIAPTAIFNDGLLDVLAFESANISRLQMAGKALEVAFQDRISEPNTAYFRTSKVRVESDPPVKMQLDGDVCGESDIDIEVLPKALRLIVPKVNNGPK